MSAYAQQSLGNASLVRRARKAAAGDREAPEQLLNELRPTIVRATRLIVGSVSWPPEDAAREALIDIAGGLQSLREPDRVSSWALRVATRRALRTARRERLFAAVRPASTVNSPEDEALSDEMDLIKAAFYRPPARMRAIAVLRLYVGASEATWAAGSRSSAQGALNHF